MRPKLKTAAAAAWLGLTAAPAGAAVFVGSWNVADGPSWTSNPQAYSGQEAAAKLLGGKPHHHRISTEGPDLADIDRKAGLDGWADTYGKRAAQDY